MIDITELSGSSRENMLMYEQNEITKEIHIAPSYVQTSVIFGKKCLTHQFRAQLEFDGLDILEHTGDKKAKLVWSVEHA